MQESFQFVLDHYKEKQGKVNHFDPVYQVLCVDLKKELESLFPSFTDLKVKGSMGNGYLSSCPWIALLNRQITTSTRHGLYVVYLFCSDMRGFYLSLNQGITYFADKYKRKKYRAAEEVARYFQNELPVNSFSSSPISLQVKRGELGYGYEKTNILSRFYPSHSFQEEELLHDLKEMMNLYSYLLSHFPSFSYEKVVEDVLNFVSFYENEDERKKRFLIKAEEAEKSLKDALEKSSPFDDIEVKLEEVEPKREVSTRLKAFDDTRTIRKKIDYLAKAQKDAEDGAKGEELALGFERERLASIGLGDYIDKMKWVAIESDSFGYDISSFDIIDGKIKEIQIEVKSTSSKVDREFPVSKGEVEASKRYKDTYYIYRIYHLHSVHPKIYRVRGALEDNFELDPISYLAYYRGKIREPNNL